MPKLPDEILDTMGQHLETFLAFAAQAIESENVEKTGVANIISTGGTKWAYQLQVYKEGTMEFNSIKEMKEED